jgi:hypothetical protein
MMPDFMKVRNYIIGTYLIKKVNQLTIKIIIPFFHNLNDFVLKILFY